MVFRKATLLGLVQLVLLAAADPSAFFGGADHEDYIDWVNEVGSSKYTGSSFLPMDTDNTQGLAVHWSLDEEYIHLGIAVRATGWVGFGLSENGGMEGADMMIFETATPDKLMDAHVKDERVPVPDKCHNWHLEEAHFGEDSGFIIVEFHRLLDTGDTQDHRIVNDGLLELPASLIVAAWGDSATHAYHGEQRARGTIRFYNNEIDGDEAFANIMKQESIGFFEMKGDNHPIPNVDTEYFDYCYSWDDLLAQGVPAEKFSVVGFEPILDAIEHLHHFTLFGSYEPMNGEPCSAYADHLDLIYGWAKGEDPAALPLDVGLYIGPGTYQSFRLEIHYDNPQLKEGVLDSSGVRFYYSEKMRPVELGLLRLGDPIISLEGQPVGDGLTQHIFDCPSTCTETMLKQEVTVLREYLHMHYAGATMQNELIRDGEVIHTGTVDYFRFDQQGNQLVKQMPYTVKKGDAYRTICNYDDKGRNATFGFSSQEEMCIVFIMYYPKQILFDFLPWVCAVDVGFASCETTHESKQIEALPRRFGRELDECPEDKPVTASTSATSGSHSLAGVTTLLASVAVVVTLLL
ncbi:hypothetical protein FisN_5Hh331 [Fistulifera solaris]|uniref:DOMON domain-containing protein n=1 Tax=Fistulifera solaris TaxID=1519565 RepID=A0A1Z5JSD8_FISSO|nr:hypothetical protein FisN_5Hh331 [Fistulifera solaris]|eukprot:GAX16953.1 hypothetical protein FisN_5Hh331 [Fistulifera solaris]